MIYTNTHIYVCTDSDLCMFWLKLDHLIKSNRMFWLFTIFSFQPRSSLIKNRKAALPRRKWQEGKSRLSGSRTQQIDKLLSVNVVMVCSRKLMSYLFFVMLKLLSSSSAAVAVFMSMLITGI